MAKMRATPPIGEFADPKNSTEAAGIYLGQLMVPKDPVLRSQGGDYAVYDQIRRDAEVKSTFQQRRLALTSKPWRVVPGDESSQAQAAADELAENLEAIDWNKATDRMLYGVFYGYAVAEIMWGIDGNRVIFDPEQGGIKVRRQREYRWDVNGDLHRLTKQKPQGLKVPDRKFWTFTWGEYHADEPYGQGLGHYLYWPAFFKRQGLKFWLIFLERFGQPTIVGKMKEGSYNDPASRNAVSAALQALRVDTSVVMPDSVEIDLLEAARSAGGGYEQMHDKMDAAIAKVVLSQTMTSNDGSSRSQAEVHMNVRQEVVESDAELLNASFNEGPVKWWTAYNYGADVPAPKVERITEEPDDLNALAERDTKIYALGYDPTPEYIERNYGEGWEKRETPEPGDEPAVSELLSQFAEFDALQGHRRDQDAIARAAHEAARNSPDVAAYFEEVQGILRESGDLETAQKLLETRAGKGPPDGLVERFKRLNVGTRLAGMIRAQRD